MVMLSMLVLAGSTLANAAPDVVRITVSAASFQVDHGSERSGDLFTVRMRCENGVGNPVVVTNAMEQELFVTSVVGIARLSPAGEIGTHSATFRSLPRGVPSLTVTNPHAVFSFTCETT